MPDSLMSTPMERDREKYEALKRRAAAILANSKKIFPDKVELEELRVINNELLRFRVLFMDRSQLKISGMEIVGWTVVPIIALVLAFYTNEGGCLIAYYLPLSVIMLLNIAVISVKKYDWLLLVTYYSVWYSAFLMCYTVVHTVYFWASSIKRGENSATLLLCGLSSIMFLIQQIKAEKYSLKNGAVYH